MIIDYDGLKGILDRLPMGILLMAEGGEVLLCNEKAPELTGCDPLDLLGSGIAAIPEESGIPVAWRRLRKGENHNETLEIVRAGRRISVSITQGDLALFGEDCVLVMLSDVTEQQRLRDLRKSVLDEILRRIKGPLTSVRTALSVLGTKDISPMSEAAREVVKLGDAEIRRLHALIGDMTELLALEGNAPGGDLYLENVDIESALRKCVRAAGKGRDRVLIVDAAKGGPCLVIADYEKLQLILSHLLSNALLYSDASQPIRIRVADDGGAFLEIRVEDREPGFPPKIYPGSSTNSSDVRSMGALLLQEAVWAFSYRKPMPASWGAPCGWKVKAAAARQPSCGCPRFKTPRA